jgi:hypothetical protein
MSNSCRKNPPSGQYYFKCTVAGQEYIPDNCANCLVVKLLGDTTLILGANKGFETLGIGINDKSQIKPTQYILNNIIGRRGDYKNSTVTYDRYFTDSLRTGLLKIISLDKVNYTISGEFSFRAYNSYRNDSISITNGSFRLKYTIN